MYISYKKGPITTINPGQYSKNIDVRRFRPNPTKIELERGLRFAFCSR